MKPRSHHRTSVFFTGSLAIIIFSMSAPCAVGLDHFWDGGTADILSDGDGASDGGEGHWSTAVANWDVGAMSHVAWPTSGTDNDAIFGGSSGLVTLQTPITANDITFNTTGYTIAAEEGNSLTLNGANATLTTGTDIAATISAAIAGSGTTVTKAGAGILTLAGVNTYTGPTSISEGTLRMSGAGTLGSGAVAVASGALLDLNGTNQTISLGAGAGTVANNSGSGTSVLTLTGLQNSVIHDSTTNEGGTVATIFNSNPNITGASTFSGGTTINATNATRFVQLSATTATLGTGEIQLVGVNSSLLGGAPVGTSLTIANNISGSGTVSNNTNGAATIVLTGLLTNTGSYTFRNAGNIYNFASTQNNTLNAVIGGANGINNISKAGSIIKSGAGKLTLTQANLYTGATTVSAGTLNIQNNTALGTTAGGVTVASGAVLELEGGITVGAEALNIRGGGIANGGALRNVSGNNTYGGAVTVPANVRFNSLGGTLTLTNTINTGAFFVVMSGAGDINLSGVISGTATAANINISKDDFADGGTGTLTLSGLNTYSGRTVISGGTLKLGAAGNATNSPLGTIAGGTFVSGTGTLDLAGFTLGTAEALSLAGSGIDNRGALANSGAAASYKGLVTLAGDASIVAGGNIALTHTGTITGAGFDLTLGGTATGSTLASAIGTGTGSLIKEGIGTWTLSGENTYTGATVISGGGTLALAASGSIDASSGVALGINGTFDVSAKSASYAVETLAGSGNVIGALTVSTELAIGNSTGTINFSDSLTLADSAAFNFELFGGSTGVGSADLGNINGLLTIGSGVILRLDQLGTYTLNDKFTLFSYDTLVGTFDGLDEGSVFSDAGGLWQISYNDVQGTNGGTETNFITITAVPEPAAALLGSLGLLALLRRRRG